MINRRALGSEKEALASNYLIEAGCEIVTRNFRSRYGEIDLIYLDRDTLCFGEVKYRKNSRAGFPHEAVTLKKQQIISRVSDFYRMKNNLSEALSYRFDVIAVTDTSITWYKNAFPYILPG